MKTSDFRTIACHTFQIDWWWLNILAPCHWWKCQNADLKINWDFWPWIFYLVSFFLVLLNGIEWFFNIQWFYGDINFLSLAITNQISSTFTNLDILYTNEERFPSRFQFWESKSSYMVRNKFYILVIFAFSWMFSV